jgi:hypothetical protein
MGQPLMLAVVLFRRGLAFPCCYLAKQAQSRKSPIRIILCEVLTL